MKHNISFEEITNRIKNVQFPDVDLVVGIANGGVVPASLVAFHLGKPIKYLHINYRDKNNTPRYDTPKIISNFGPSFENQRILLVDDVSVTGKTFRSAADFLSGNEVTTFAIKGTADIVLFPEITQCVNWPWKEIMPQNQTPAL